MALFQDSGAKIGKLSATALKSNKDVETWPLCEKTLCWGLTPVMKNFMLGPDPGDKFLGKMCGKSKNCGIFVAE